MDRRVGYLLVAASAVAFGAMPIFARFAVASGADTPTMLFLRFGMASVALCAIVVARGLTVPRGRTLAVLALMGAGCYVGQSLAYFTALTMASVGLVALLLYLYPVIVTAAAVAFLGERFTVAKGCALALALVGSALTLGEVGGGHPVGVALGLLSAAIYSVYILVGSRVTPRAGPLPSAAVIITSTAVVYGLIVAVRGAHLPQTVGGWAAIIALGLVSTVISLTAFFAGLARIGPVNTATLSSIEPATSVALGALVLHEAVVPAQVAGGALILAAVVVLARGSAPPQE